MFGPFLESFEWVKAQNPRSFLKKPRFNFITIHCMSSPVEACTRAPYAILICLGLDIYLLCLAIIGSILLYPAGNMAYIDALFLASGCATQSGLNTIDVNKLNTYQQVVFYFMAMVATPVFINTFVVFVRLYWFEQRFQHVVREARNMGRTRTRSRTKTDAREDASDPGLLERGVKGRDIVVLHNGESRNGSADDQYATDKVNSDKELDSATASSSSQGDRVEPFERRPQPPLQQPPTFHREVTFADEVEKKKDTVSPLETIPQRLSPEQHIAFLENQRNPKDKGTLRIPGPREFDRGDVPKALIDEDDGGPLNHEVASPIERRETANGTPLKRDITIDGSGQPIIKTDTGNPHKHSIRKTGNLEAIEATPTDELGPPSARLRSRTGTFGSLKASGSREKDPMPYLSWQPTLGRNSAFVDLTEEQREELGGIEYRSLKTLAIVLVCEFINVFKLTNRRITNLHSNLAYYVFFHLLGVVTLTPWIIRSGTYGSILDSDGQSRTWW